MHDTLLKLTEDAVAAIDKAVAGPETQKLIEETKAAKEKNGKFEVIISTEHVDRMQEIIKQDGWQLERYMKNPVVLWGHDYRQLPIGVAEELSITEYEGQPALKATGYFAAHDFAQSIRELYDAKIVRATSVGFIPKKYDEQDMNIITIAELLEFSFVSVPANSFALSTLNATGYSEAQIGGLIAKGILNTKVAEMDEEETVDEVIDDAEVPETDTPEEKAEDVDDESDDEEETPEEEKEPSDEEIEKAEDDEPSDDDDGEETPEGEDADDDTEKDAKKITIEKTDDTYHLKYGDESIEISEEVAADMHKAISVLQSTNQALKHFEIAILALEGLKKDLEGGEEEEPDESADDQDPSEKEAAAAAALLSLRKDVQKIVSIAGEALYDARKEAEKHYKS